MTTKGRHELQELEREVADLRAYRDRNITLGLELGQILGPDYDGVDLRETARELVATKRRLAALRAHLDLRAWVQHKPECNALHPLWCDDEGILRETKRLTTTNCGVAPGFLCAGHSRACTCGLDAALSAAAAQACNADRHLYRSGDRHDFDAAEGRVVAIFRDGSYLFDTKAGTRKHYSFMPDSSIGAALRSLKEGRQAQAEASAAPQEEP